MKTQTVRESIRQQTSFIKTKPFDFHYSMNQKLSRRVKWDCEKIRFYIMHRMQEITNPMELKLNTYSDE